jgi:hypothetical protein
MKKRVKKGSCQGTGKIDEKQGRKADVRARSVQTAEAFMSRKMWKIQFEKLHVVMLFISVHPSPYKELRRITFVNALV